MSAALLAQLVEVGLAMSAAIGVVAVLRSMLRRVAGARLAYWLWVLVPLSALAVVVPGATPAVTNAGAVSALHTSVDAWRSSRLTAGVAHAGHVLAIWGFGSLVRLWWMLIRQRRLVRSLGLLLPLPDGTHRSECCAGPLLLGLWRPRIVMPADFESRYCEIQQALILAHEQAHQRRGDLLVNALAEILHCVYWFNPLMYWALPRLRFDQDLACDAAVLGAAGASPRHYADALLQVQLASQGAALHQSGCHWNSTHPLKERIAMIKNPLPGRMRRLAGTVLVATVICSGTYAAWAAQPESVKLAEVEVIAERITTAPDGSYQIGGKVSVIRLSEQQRFVLTSDRIEQRSDGAFVAEGTVRIELPKATLTSERAVLEKSGVMQFEDVKIVVRK